MAVTVAELIEGLKALDPNLLVILSSDEEGNRYAPLSEQMGTGPYLDNGGEGMVVHPDDEADYPGGTPAVVFYPGYM